MLIFRILLRLRMSAYAYAYVLVKTSLKSVSMLSGSTGLLFCHLMMFVITVTPRKILINVKKENCNQ